MDRFFQFTNLFPMPLWLAMMFAPNHRLTHRASRSSVVFMVAAGHYFLALLRAFRGSGNEGEMPNFTTLDGVSKALGTKEGALAGWTHMLALDLFTGAWIYRQCQRLNAPAWVRVPALLFTLMTGPFGLLLFLSWRVLAVRTDRIDLAD